MKKHVYIQTILLAIFAMLFLTSACTRPSAARLQSYPLSTEEIPGAFGYAFGTPLNRSMIVEQMVSENPLIFDEYLVKPIKRSREFDIYSVTTCKYTGIICCIRGFTNFNNKYDAIKYLEAVRPIIQNKYGPLVVRYGGYNYEEYTGNASTRISLIVLSDQTGWTFMIKYSNEILKHRCQF